jgi:hypothetical protein
MITPKQQYSVFNILPPSGDYGGFEGLDRIRSFNMQRRNSHDHTGDDQTNPRGSLTPGINFDQYTGLPQAMHGNILPVPDMQANNIYSNIG